MLSNGFRSWEFKQHGERRPVLVDAALKRRLTPLYAAAERHYHGLAHIEALRRLAARLRAELNDPAAVDAAIWFHDAVYDSRRADNEEKSAALAAAWLAGRAAPVRLARIVAMIKATAGHELPALDSAAAQGRCRPLPRHGSGDPRGVAGGVRRL